MRFIHWISDAWAWLLDLGAQVSGVQFPWVGLIIIGIALVLGVVRLYRWMRTELATPDSLLQKVVTATRRRLIPLMFGAMAIAGALLIVAAVVGAIAYSHGSGTENTPPLNPQTTAPPPPEPHYSQKEKNDLLDSFRDLTTMLNKYGLGASNLGNQFVSDWEEQNIHPFNKNAITNRLSEVRTLAEHFQVDMFEKYIRGNAYEAELNDMVSRTQRGIELNQLLGAINLFINGATYVALINKDGDDWEKTPAVYTILELHRLNLLQALTTFNGWLNYCRGRISDRSTQLRR